MITSLKKREKRLKKPFQVFSFQTGSQKLIVAAENHFFPDQDYKKNKTNKKQTKKQSNLTQTNQHNTVLKMQPSQLIGNG